MKNQNSGDLLAYFEEFIVNFENKKFEEKNSNFGVIYTPKKIVDFITKNIFEIYFKDLLGSPNCFQKGLTLENLTRLIKKDPEVFEKLSKKIKRIKILDPACGSGRFLISAAKILFKIYKILYPEICVFDVKKEIIKRNLFGIDIDAISCNISKLRLFTWLFSKNTDFLKNFENFIKIKKIEDFNVIFDKFELKFNIYNLDFLLEFNSNENLRFDFIIGNPPYIENKKIENLDFKRRLYNNFKSAFKLFDLSIVFIEKSLELLSDSNGYLSFILTNKFLSADYGIKIRRLLLQNAELKEIINISSLSVFRKTSAYPIIITLKKKIPNHNNVITIKKFDKLEDLFENDNIKFKFLPQKLIKKLPRCVIPISGNISLIKYLYNNFKTMGEAIKDLKMIYRPFGFTKWAKHFDNIYKDKELNNISKKALILIGTGNVGKFHIKFDKKIRIAKKNLKMTYFKFNEKYKSKWQDLSREKLIFREIAKDLTCVYDPGIFANITGLYYIRVPSFNTNKLFSLLTILNSTLMDTVFKTLFSTLHMSGGYLRFNGSFVKRLPMLDRFPQSLGFLGKIILLLSQLKYDMNKNPDFILFEDIKSNEIEKFLNFFLNLANSLVILLYLKKKRNQNYQFLENLLNSKNLFSDIQFKFLIPRYNLPKFQTFNKKDLNLILLKINNLYSELSKKEQLIYEINSISTI